MPNVKIKTWRTRTSEDKWQERSICDGLFLMDGNWKYPESGKDGFGNVWPTDDDGDPVEFHRPHGKIIPGEVVEIDAGHPALNSGMLEITDAKADRTIKGIPGGKVRKRRGRPPKVNTDNAEVRDSA